MGSVIGDHKIAFGNGKAGRVLFIDIGALRGRRCLGLFTATRAGDAEAYQGHVVMTSVSGQDSPEAFPVQFSVRAGEEDRAIAAGLTACVHVADRTIMPSWDGRATAEFETLQDVTKKIRDFSGQVNQNPGRTDPRVVRTGIPRAAFRAPGRQSNEDVKPVIVPSPQEIGVNIGAPEPGFEAMAAARKVAAPASKVGHGPILAPDLDMEAAKQALEAVFQPSSLTVDFYGGAGLPREDAEDTRFGDRAQAAKSFPILAEIIANAPDIARAIDARAPIQPMVIERTGLSKGALKRLSKITRPFNQESVMGDERVITMTDQLGVNRQSKFVVRGTLSLGQALEHLKELPPDWVPDNNEAWEDFADVLGGLAIPLSHITGKTVKELLSSSKGDWKAFKATLAKAADVPVEEFNRAQMSAISGEIMTMTETFARTAVLPMIANVLKRAGQSAVVQRNQDLINTGLERAVDATPAIICGRAKSPMVALLEAERRFISRDTAISAISTGLDEEDLRAREQAMTDKERQMGDMAGNKAFPVLRETWVASNGYEVVPFRSEADMRAEGDFMHHCVGSIHAKNGSSGSYHYFSIRHPDTMGDARQRGTLRILPISPGKKIEIGEFRSLRNSEVNAACKAAFREWKDSFLQEDLDAAGARMDEWREFRRARGLNSSATARTPEEIWEGRIGVKVGDERVAGALWDEWANNVLSGWPAGNPEVLFRNAEVRELLSTFSPAAADFLIQEAAQRKAADAETPTP